MTKKEIELIEKISRVNSLRVIQRLHEGAGFVMHLIEEEISKLDIDIDVLKQFVIEDTRWWEFKD